MQKWLEIIMAENGQDDEATEILCQITGQLHDCSRISDKIPEGLTPLNVWFKDLIAVEHQSDLFSRAAQIARQLLNDPEKPCVLHGDIHHGNVLWSDQNGGRWKAIDPKGLYGERGFDYAKIFCNPNNQLACSKERFLSRLAIVQSHSKMEQGRLLMWIIAWSALSALWSLQQGPENGETAVGVVSLAMETLARIKGLE